MKAALVVVAVLSLYSAVAFAREIRRKPLKLSDEPIWSNCTKENDLMNIESVMISPREIKENENVNIVLQYTLKREVDGGNINIDLAGVPGIGNLNTDVSVCDALSFLGQSCQVKEGRGMFNVTQAVPELGESAHITGTLVGKDPSGSEIFCIKLNVTLQD